MTKTDTDQSGRRKAWAAQSFLHNNRLIRVGEELQLYASPEEIATFVELGHASREPVATEAAIYATVRLSYNPPGGAFIFEPGDRLDGVVPHEVLQQRIANGEATYDNRDPEASR